MTARILTGKEPAAEQRAEVAERVAALGSDGVSVGLATLLVGDDPASAVYVGMKHKAAVQAGIKSIDRRLGAETTQEEVDAAIDDLNADPEVTAYIVHKETKIVTEEEMRVAGFTPPPPAKPAPVAAPKPAPAPAPAPMLPKTGSNLPLVGFAGLMALLVGLGIAVIRR